MQGKTTENIAAVKLCVIGATLSGNKGAASMLIGLVNNARNISDSGCKIECLSIYAKRDEKFNFYPDLKIIKCTPFDLICIAFPLALIFFLARRITFLKNILRANKILNSIFDADLVINMAGISYSDKRGLILIYNIACDCVPLLLGKKVFKYSQALGPFKTFLNRISAKMILPRVTKIAARGKITMDYLLGLGINNAECINDGAFLMTASEAYLSADIKKVSDSFRKDSAIRIAVSASSVVEEYCRAKNILYTEILATLIDDFPAEAGVSFLIFPFCALEGKKSKKNNDLPTVSRIQRMLPAKKNITCLVREYSAEDLRFIISQCDIIITSRYHGMITALSEGVVPLVIGWSHKYTETLDYFSLSSLCINYREMNAKDLQDKLAMIIKNLESYKRSINDRVGAVKRDSFRNITLIKELVMR